jgi:hypothetical protein
VSSRPRHFARVRLPQEYWQTCRFGMPGPLDSYYDEEVLADAPMLYWPLGEPTNVGTTVDLSGNGIVGAYVTGRTQGPPLVTGLPNAPPSIVTPLQVDSGMIQSTSFALAENITMTGWASFRDGQNEDFLTGTQYLMVHREPGRPSLSVNGDVIDFSTDVNVSGLITPRVPMFLAGTNERFDRVGLVVQGSLVADGNGANATSPEAPLVVGLNAPSMRLGHLAVYNTAVSSERLAAHYAAGIRDPATMNRGGIGFGPDTCRYEGPPQRWHFPASVSPRGTDSFTVFVVCQLSSTAATQMLLHTTAAPIATSGFELDWAVGSGFRWSEVDDVGGTTSAIWSASVTSRHVFAISHIGGMAPLFVAYADGDVRAFAAGRAWTAPHTLTIGTFIGPIRVLSGAVEQVYIVGSALTGTEVTRISEALL